MTMVDGDWTIERSTGNIRYIGDDHGGASPSYATVIEFHRWLQDFADQEVSSGDDELDITDLTPSERSTDNILTLKNNFQIDDAAAEHLYDGSIIQGTGGTEVIYDGIVNFGAATVQIQIIQNGAVLSDDWWNFGGGGLNADSDAGISHRFMLKVRDAGADIDGRRLIGISRTFGYTYSEFKINGTARGNNVLALTQAADLNNETANATVASWTTITNNTVGYVGLDVNADTTDEYYYSEWDIDTANHDINDFYERMKYMTQDSTPETLYGISGELFRGITHQIAVTPNTVNSWSDYEPVSWNTGTGQMLAIDSTSTPTKMWIQILTGTAPVTSAVITGTTSSSTADAGTVTSREPVSTPFCGASTGSAIIGSYGLGIQPSDLTAADKLTDLSGNVITPPNNVTFSVYGLYTAEDRVLVTNDQATGIDYDQMTLQTALTGNSETTANVGTGNIPDDTPSSGTIRIETDSGRYVRVAYDSYNTSHFTFNASEDFGADNASATNNVFISYIDKLATANTEAFTTVYDGDRTLFVRVRDGGASPIKTFETTGTLGSSGGSATAIRTSDA